MKTTIQKPLIVTLAIALTTLMGSNVLADSHAPPPRGVVETFSCTYNAGQDMDDLMAARDYFSKQAKKEGVKTGDAYVWSLYKGASPIDFVWFAAHDNMAAFAASADQPPNAEMAKVTDRFEQVATCQRGMGFITNVFTNEGAPEPSGETTFITSSACAVSGASQGEMKDLWNHINGTFKGMGAKAPLATYVINPITSGPESADAYVFNVNANVTAWSNFMDGINSTEAGQSLLRHFGAVMDCNFAMFYGQQVMSADG